MMQGSLFWSLLAVPVLFIFYALLHATYNVYLHPLRRVPGPRLWATSRLPWCWHQYQGRLQHRILELHRRYGHAVRVAPDEISFTSDTAWKTIYRQRSVEMRKDPNFSLLTPTGAQNILVADRSTHIRQRRLLSHAFSEKALREQETILQLHTNKLLELISRNSRSRSFNVVAKFNFLTFDLIGDLTFGENFGCLDKDEYAPFVGSIQAMATELTYNQMWKYWRLLGIKRLFMSKAVAGKRVENVKRAMAAVDRRMRLETTRKDLMHYILSANDEKGMSPQEIHVNAFSLNIAGSESTATAMCGVTFLTLTHPHIYTRLVAEIRERFSSQDNITLASTHGLEFLEAVITEAMRLFPPVAISMPRRTPAGGETIDGIFVPDEMTVGVHPFSAYRHPDNFFRPDSFLPERWLAGPRDNPPFKNDNRDCMQPFSFGPRNCLGKNLARAEMRLALAKIIQRFDMELVKGQEGWLEGQKAQGFWQKPPLYCTFKERR